MFCDSQLSTSQIFCVNVLYSLDAPRGAQHKGSSTWYFPLCAHCVTAHCRSRSLVRSCYVADVVPNSIRPTTEVSANAAVSSPPGRQRMLSAPRVVVNGSVFVVLCHWDRTEVNSVKPSYG